jgi:hypothetical protein
MAVSDKYLPGGPPPRLIRQVRRSLRSDGMTVRSEVLWRTTWEWASSIRNSYVFPKWPLPAEIATQYILLMLLDRQASRQLRLPHRAKETKYMPEVLRQRMLAAVPFFSDPAEVPALPAPQQPTLTIQPEASEGYRP